MGKPSARIGDSCAHGGKIVKGEFTVIIGGRPASRITDMHVCPAVCPGPAPHVGGPIIPPCAVNVLIGGLPAARIGDKAICACAIDSIVSGETTVLIGTSSAGMPVVPSRIPVHQSVKKKTAAPGAPNLVGGGGAEAAPAPQKKWPTLPPKQTLLDTAGVSQGAPAPAGSTSVELAQDLAAKLRDNLSKRKMPAKAAVAVDKRTGKVYAGISGRPFPEVHPDLQERVDARKGVKPPEWDPRNCAEFYAVNAALHAGAKVDDLDVSTVFAKTGEPEERCPHCQTTTKGATVPTDDLAQAAASGRVGAGAAGAAEAEAPQGPSPGQPGAMRGQEQTMSCGIASSRMVIESMNRENWPEATLRQQAGQLCGFNEKMGTPFDNLPDLLTAHGIKASPAGATSVDQLARQARPDQPAIVDVGGHAIVVDEVVKTPDGGRLVRVRDPQRGPGYIDEQTFGQMYTGQAITTSRW